MRHGHGPSILQCVALAVLIGPFAGSAAAGQEILGNPAVDPAIAQKVAKAVAARFPDPAGISVRDIRPSKARNGRGYCGGVAEHKDGPFQPFQVILDGDGASVLILPAAGASDSSISRDNAELLLRNAGCLEPQGD